MADKRYANAYLETAIELKVLEKAKEDMLLIQNTFRSSPDLRVFLHSPVIKKEKKRAAIEAIFADKIQDIARQFLKVKNFLYNYKFTEYNIRQRPGNVIRGYYKIFY